MLYSQIFDNVTSENLFSFAHLATSYTEYCIIISQSYFALSI